MTVVTAATASRRRFADRGEQVVFWSLIAVFVAYIWIFRLRGWYPHDDGTLGQSAERVLRGQIPHRDFDDPYTGGLGLLHALVFRIGGVSLTALRNFFAGVTTLWFALLLRFFMTWLRPLVAAITAGLIVLWSVPLYPAAMPSWYVLFLVTGAGILLVRVGRPRSMLLVFCAGVLIGLGLIVKITAMFALAGALWALAALRRQLQPDSPSRPEVVAAGVIIIAMTIRLLASGWTGRVAMHLALPPVAMVVALVMAEVRSCRRRGWAVDPVLWRQSAVLTLGAAVPVAIFALWLGAHGGLMPLVASLRDVVRERTAESSFSPPSVESVLLGVPLALVLFVTKPALQVRWPVVLFAGVIVGAFAWRDPIIHQDVWHAVRALVPIGSIAFLVWWPTRVGVAPVESRRVLAVFVPMTAMMVLTQFPFAAPIYFIYIVPLLVVAIVARAIESPSSNRRAVAVLAGLVILFAMTQVVPSSPEDLGYVSQVTEPRSWLRIPRARLLVLADDAEEYRRLVALFDSVPPGPIWAGPDAPAVAFLSGRRDSNRSFFAFLSRPGEAGTNLAGQLASGRLQAVVVNTAPAFSRQVSPSLVHDIQLQFPERRDVGQFQIYLRANP